MILDMLNESNLFDSFTNQEENLLENVEGIAIDESEDPVSACYRITMENEQNWFNIMNTIAFSELAYMEAHEGSTEAMYEAADFKKIKDTIVAFIKNAWAKLKGVIQKAISNLTDVLNGDKRLCAAYLKKIKEKPELEKKTATVPKYSVLSGSKSDLVSFILGIGLDAHREFDELWGFTDYANTYLCNDKCSKFESKKFEGLKGDEMKDALYNTSEVKISGSDAYAKVNSGKNVTFLKNLYKVEEKEFNKLISQFNKEKADEAKNDFYNNASKVVALKSKYVKQTISVLNMAVKACIQAVNKDYAKNRAILKAIVGGKGEDPATNAKKDDKKAANESADLICALI